MLHFVREMGVAVNGEPVGAHVHDALDRPFPGPEILCGKAVYKVKIDAAKARVPARFVDTARLIFRLAAADGLLNFGVQILHAHADPVETQAPKRVDLFEARYPGVDFEGQLRIGIQLKMLAYPIEESFELLHGQIGWRSAAPMELEEPAPLAQYFRDVGQLLGCVVQELLYDLRLLGNDDVATAVVAALLAKGNMDIHHESFIGRLRGSSQGRTVVVRVETRAPFRDRGIAGVPRAGPIVLFQ